MPDVTVAAGKTGSSLVTLVANQISTVTFNEDLDYVEVITDGASAVWWTCNGDTPAQGEGYYVPAMVAMDQRSPIRNDDKTTAKVVVKLWSAGTPVVRVQRA